MKTATEIISAGLFDAAVALMDDDIREAVHASLAPCSEEAFLEEYMLRHEQKYHVPFTIEGEPTSATNEKGDITMTAETAALIHDMLETLSNEPNFDTFDAAPNYHCFPDLCDLLGVEMTDFSSYGDLFYALMDAAISAGVDVTDIRDNLEARGDGSEFGV